MGKEEPKKECSHSAYETKRIDDNYLGKFCCMCGKLLETIYRPLRK